MAVEPILNPSASSPGHAAAHGALAVRHRCGALPVSAATICGHSWLVPEGWAGGIPGVTQDTWGIAPRVGAMLNGATVTNLAISGSKLMLASVNGSWRSVMQSVLRPRTAAPWIPVGGLHVAGWGINDAAEGSYAANAASWRACLLTVVSRFRAAAVFEDDHASVVGSVGTTTTASTAANSGAGWLVIDPGETATISVPADYTGTPITIAFQTGEAANAGTATITEGATPLATVPTGIVLAASGFVGTTCARIENLAPGAHTLVVSAATHEVRLDWWGIEAEPAPPVVLMGVARLPSYEGLWALASDAGVASYHAQAVSVAAQFTDGLVGIADIDPLLDAEPTLFQPTGPPTHVNEAGAAIVAGAIYDALALLPLTSHILAHR